MSLFPSLDLKKKYFPHGYSSKFEKGASFKSAPFKRGLLGLCIMLVYCLTINQNLVVTAQCKCHVLTYIRPSHIDQSSYVTTP